MVTGHSVPANRLYWPQLDGLRFLAVLLVFLHHAPFLPGVPGFVKLRGWMGVDLFLVLSAYLITRLVRQEIESSGTFDVRRFFVRRICRIWPLYFAFVTAMLVVSYVEAPEAFDRARALWISHLGFFNNFVTGLDGWDESLVYSQHLWTIPLEEQYYVLVPVVVPFLVRRRGSRSVGFWLAGALAALWLARAACVAAGVGHPFIWTTPLRMDAMVLGTALGLGLLERPWLRARGGLCFAAGCALLLAATRLPPVHHVGWAQVPIYAIVDAACVLLVIGSLHSTAVAGFFSTRVIRYLGKVSFGIYVFQFAVLRRVGRFAVANGISDPWQVFGVALLATCLLASMSYELFEKQFLKLKMRYTVVASRPV